MELIMQYIEDANAFSEWIIKSQEISKMSTKKYILKNFQSPGDILMLTSCVRDIKMWYPEIELNVESSTPDIWLHNPYITTLHDNDPDVCTLDMQYEIIHQSNENINNHFIHGFIHDFNQKTGLAVKLTDFKADVHLTDDEKFTPVFEDQPDKFIVLVAGGKTDYKTKWWWIEAWTEVVKNCPDIQFIQVGKDEHSHIHSKIRAKNCINKLGQTSFRQLMRLVYQSIGTLSVVTAAMHLSAAFNKHAAVIAGGHEPWWWEKYPKHDYFHTIGRLSCCRFGGCWKGECENKNESNGRQKCLELINPIKVSDTINGWL